MTTRLILPLMFAFAVVALAACSESPTQYPEPSTLSSIADRTVLVTLYNSTNGIGWKHSDNWLSDKPIGEWHGVTTDDEGRVTQLILAENGLIGEIPLELGDLAYLSRLELPGNLLIGYLPPELVNLTNLSVLDLSKNHLIGGIPSELSTLTILESLKLHENGLSGEIPSELGELSDLRELNLSRNQLIGEIPPELGNIANLTELNLRGNQLTGCIPDRLEYVGQTLPTDIGLAFFCGDGALRGRLLFRLLGEEVLEIYTMKLGGTEAIELPDAYGWWSAVSPDGRRIAAVRYGDIYVMNADGSGRTQLTDHTGSDSMPSWSPDSNQIAFHSERDGNFEIYVMNADGSGKTRLTNHPENDRNPHWAPDGRRMLFNAHRDGNRGLYVMNTDGTNVTLLMTRPEWVYEASWSPDGRRIAFTLNTSEGIEWHSDIYVMNADGSDVTRLTGPAPKH